MLKKELNDQWLYKWKIFYPSKIAGSEKDKAKTR